MGGEVRLEFLDDIDRSTALIDGRVLQYDGSLVSGLVVSVVVGLSEETQTLDNVWLLDRYPQGV